MSFHEKTVFAAKGKWKGILLQLGVPENCLTGKHAPCPLCGGVDRFRFDNKESRGTWICNNCQAGDGMELAKRFTGLDFPQVAAQIDKIIGNVKDDGPAPEPLTPEQKRYALRAVYSQTRPIEPGDLADKYFTARGLGRSKYPENLRLGLGLKDGEGGLRPAIVAIVHSPEYQPVTLHRTYLREDGLAKAEMESPRKLMPGDVPDGSAIRLFPVAKTLGVAEGIETALSAARIYQMPVWSLIDTGKMEKWMPPEGVEKVAVFADNDKKYGGQKAAYTLAHKLACRDFPVRVILPLGQGKDWNDTLTQWQDDVELWPESKRVEFEELAGRTGNDFAAFLQIRKTIY